MIKPSQAPNEAKRLNALNSLEILDTESDPRLDQLVKLASLIADTPIALLSLVDKDRQWFKAKVGLDVDETPRDISFCGHAILAEDHLFEIPDATMDERFKSNPLVTSGPGIKFYAGNQLKTTEGHSIGTLCVIDKSPKKLTSHQQQQLKILSEEIMSYLEDQKKVSRLKSDVNSKAAFVASLSHELRTPLTSVIGFADVLASIVRKDPFEKESALKNVQILKSSSEHLLGLIGDILDFSKLEARKFNLNQETFPLNKALKQIYNTLSIQAEKYDVSFNLQSSMSAPEFIYADLTLLKQIFINLGSNAIKFSSGESVEINVDTSSIKKQHLSIDFIDTGIGMSEKEAERVFRPFTQANDKIASKFDGTGLGLAITKEIVELMDGKVTLVRSKKGIGTHFKIEIPFVEKILDNDSSKRSSPLTNISEILHEKKILIVDDIKENRFLVRHYLKDFDVEFKDAVNGQDAINKFNDHFDYILLDMQLPDINGIEVFNHLKDKAKPHQKFIAFTASSTRKGIKECLNHGFSAYLTKPFNTQTILEALKINFS